MHFCHFRSISIPQKESILRQVFLTISTPFNIEEMNIHHNLLREIVQEILSCLKLKSQIISKTTRLLRPEWFEIRSDGFHNLSSVNP